MADIKPELPTVAIRPTKANPDIKVVIGNDNGNLIPKQIIYPDSFSDEEIQEKAIRFKNNGTGCKVCKRYKAEQQRRTFGIFGIAVVMITVLIGYGIYKSRRRKRKD